MRMSIFSAGAKARPNRFRRVAAIAAATVAAGTLAVVAPAAAQASTYCTGNLIQQVDAYGYSSRLIGSYDGGSICVNVWNQTGGQAWTWAFIKAANGGATLASDGPGYWWQYASTGFIGKPSAGTCIWFGGNNVNPQNYNGTYVDYLHCF